jgi:hypothetical protein
VLVAALVVVGLCLEDRVVLVEVAVVVVVLVAPAIYQQLVLLREIMEAVHRHPLVLVVEVAQVLMVPMLLLLLPVGAVMVV